MEFFTVIAAISALVALFFIATVAMDIIKTVWSKLKDRPYEWKSTSLFTEIKDWKSALLLAVAIFIGAYVIISEYGRLRSIETSAVYEDRIFEYEDQIEEYKNNLIECDYCWEQIPEEYIFIDDGESVCPRCVYGSFEEITSDGVSKCWNCNDFFPTIYGHGMGLCESCGNKYVSECNGCGNPAIRWENTDGLTLCPSCIGEIYANTRVSDEIEAWFEG